MAEHTPRQAGYGSSYWGVVTPADKGGTAMLWADELRVDPSGALLCIGHQKDGTVKTLAAFAPGVWIEFFAASVIDGSQIIVEQWSNE